MNEEVYFTCPYCWERISVVVDCSVAKQTYVEDCEVCCKPIQLFVRCRKGKFKTIEAECSV